MKINIFTDGAYSPKTEKGGWAVYCPELRLRMCGAVKDTTNNRMELLSAIKALEFVDNTHLHLTELSIYSDSKYLVETMNGRYQQKTNLDLWNQLDDLVNNMLFPVKFYHIKGHTGENNGNNVADILANLVSQKL